MQSTTRFGTSRFGTWCTMTLAAAGLLVMPAAQAQQQSPSGPSVTTPSPTTAPTTIPDKKLDAAAAAVKKVSVIKNKYDQQLAQAPVAEKKRLEDEAGDAMVKAVTDQGLSIEEYTAILKVAQKDPVVHDKLLQRMK
jgi:predicted ATPase with chaperone activity